MEKAKTIVQSNLKSDLKAITDLIGPLNQDAIHAIYGASQVGKTLLQLQILYEVSHKTERPTLAYDTEGGMREFVEHWGPIFKKRYPKAVVDVRMKRDFRQILRDHGKLVKIKMSGDKAKSDEAKMNTGGKLGLTIVEDVYPSPILQLVQKRNYAMVFYDSVSMPMKYFGSEQQNFPARGSAMNLWFAEMLNIIDEGDCYVFASHHSSKNPALPYAREEMSGGTTVQFYSKVILYLKKWNSKGGKVYRSLKLSRFFDKPPNEYETIMELTDAGYVDVDKSKIETK